MDAFKDSWVAYDNVELVGDLSLEHRSDQAFHVGTFQVIKVSNGHYSLSAWVNSDNEKKANRMYARAGDLFETDIPTTARDDYR